MESEGLISVIVPVYNTAEYLERCVNSIINQTYKNLEIILIDDGSTDRSGKICDKFKEEDTRVSVVHQKNSGPSVARNYGLSIAKGEYIGFVDSDDYIAADMYEQLYGSMRSGIDIVCCGSINIDRHKRTVNCKVTCKKSFDRENAIFELLKSDNISFSAWDKLFKKNVINDIRFPENRLCEDLPFIYQAVKQSKGIVHIGKVKYFYCYRQESRSKSDFSLKRMDYIFFTRDIYRDVNKNFPELSRMAEYRYFININYIICQIEHMQNKNVYNKELVRLKDVLKRMRLRIILNPFLNKEQRRACLSAAR